MDARAYAGHAVIPSVVVFAICALDGRGFTIASALGWTVDRVLDAAGGLRTELRRAGQTVTITASHDLALASHADGISDEIRADLHPARVRIDDTAAALLHRIITGRHEDRLASTLNDKELNDRHAHDRRRDPH